MMGFYRHSLARKYNKKYNPFIVVFKPVSLMWSLIIFIFEEGYQEKNYNYTWSKYQKRKLSGTYEKYMKKSFMI